MKNLKQLLGMSWLQGEVSSIQETLSTEKACFLCMFVMQKISLRKFDFRFYDNMFCMMYHGRNTDFIGEMRLALLSRRRQEWRDLCIKNEWKEASRLEQLMHTEHANVSNSFRWKMTRDLTAIPFVPILVSYDDFKHPRVCWEIYCLRQSTRRRG